MSEIYLGPDPILPSGLIMFEPSIICHPNIPKPLHGIAPRTIMGDSWWNKIKKKVYLRYDYHCAACGVHKSRAKKNQWLEAHEFYGVDYETGTVVVKSIEPLCHFCHNFIHSGRMTALVGQKNGIGRSTVKAILEHGFELCLENDLSCFYVAVELAHILEMDPPDELMCYTPEINPDIQWGDWKLLWNGKEYKSKFDDQEDWDEFYNK